VESEWAKLAAKLVSARRLPDLPGYGSTAQDWQKYHKELRRTLDRDDSRAINQALNIPAFRVNRTADQTGVATATETRIAFTTAAIDTHSFFDVTTNYRYTPKVAGIYLFAVVARWNYAAANTHFVKIYQNGVEAAVGLDYFTVGATGPTLRAQTLLVMNGGTDYVDFFCYQNSGSSQPLLAGAYAYGHKVCD
jgi:hypothetical protein